MGLGFGNSMIRRPRGGEAWPPCSISSGLRVSGLWDQEEGSHLPIPSPRTSVTVGGDPSHSSEDTRKLLVRRQEETWYLPPEGLLPFRSHRLGKP